jgi:hypothetical protein
MPNELVEDKAIFFTPIEQRIMKALSDGRPHHRDDILDCLLDPMAQRYNVYNHISKIRSKLRPHHHDILCVLRQGTIFYQHVILLCALSDLCRDPI